MNSLCMTDRIFFYEMIYKSFTCNVVTNWYLIIGYKYFFIQNEWLIAYLLILPKYNCGIMIFTKISTV